MKKRPKRRNKLLNKTNLVLNVHCPAILGKILCSNLVFFVSFFHFRWGFSFYSKILLYYCCICIFWHTGFFKCSSTRVLLGLISPTFDDLWRLTWNTFLKYLDQLVLLPKMKALSQTVLAQARPKNSHSFWFLSANFARIQTKSHKSAHKVEKQYQILGETLNKLFYS